MAWLPIHFLTDLFRTRSALFAIAVSAVASAASAAPSSPKSAPHPVAPDKTSSPPSQPAPAKPAATPARQAKIAAADSAAPKAYRGTAYDTERGGFAYTEEHDERFQGGKLAFARTEFLSVDGHPFARCELDFARFPWKPDYRFTDARNGYEEGSVVEAGAIAVHFRDSTRAPLKEKRLEVPEPCVVNGGVGLYIKENWDALKSGKKLLFNMVVPARLDFYRFMAYVDPEKTLPSGEAAGRKNQAIIIEPQNYILRKLLPTIVMTYDEATRRLIRYQGIVNVADAKGRSLRVRVDYPGLGP
jgi:hypothetical protein